VDRGGGIVVEAGSLRQVQRSGCSYRLGTAPGIKLAINVVDVRVDGAHGNEQLLGDLPVRQSGGDQAQYFQLALGQALDEGLRRAADTAIMGLSRSRTVTVQGGD